MINTDTKRIKMITLKLQQIQAKGKAYFRVWKKKKVYLTTTKPYKIKIKQYKDTGLSLIHI